jgi:hypothetical protein
MTYKSDFNFNFLEYNPEVTEDSATILFENLPELIIPQVAAKFLNKSVKTLYDWNFRGKTRKRKIPSDLFLKVGGSLYIKKDVLSKWISNRSSSY